MFQNLRAEISFLLPFFLTVRVSSADVAVHGCGETRERAERDAEHNEAVRNHGVLTKPSGPPV